MGQRDQQNADYGLRLLDSVYNLGCRGYYRHANSRYK